MRVAPSAQSQPPDGDAGTVGGSQRAAPTPPDRELTVTFLDSPLWGPIDHPIINLLTYVRGGLYDYDARTALTMLLEPGQMFIDVGANIGPYSVLAANLVGASGQIVAIEPSADQLPYLRHLAGTSG